MYALPKFSQNWCQRLTCIILSDVNELHPMKCFVQEKSKVIWGCWKAERFSSLQGNADIQWPDFFASFHLINEPCAVGTGLSLVTAEITSVNGVIECMEGICLETFRMVAATVEGYGCNHFLGLFIFRRQAIYALHSSYHNYTGNSGNFFPKICKVK